MAEGRVRRVLPEDLSNVEFETSEEVEVVPTFDNMGLKQDLIRGIYAYGEYILKKWDLFLRLLAGCKFVTH